MATARELGASRGSELTAVTAKLGISGDGGIAVRFHATRVRLEDPGIDANGDQVRTPVYRVLSSTNGDAQKNRQLPIAPGYDNFLGDDPNDRINRILTEAGLEVVETIGTDGQRARIRIRPVPVVPLEPGTGERVNQAPQPIHTFNEPRRQRVS